MFSGKIFSKLKENWWKLTISIIAAIVMYFTPDHIDEWIKSTAPRAEPKNRFESSTSEVYSEPPRPKPTTKLANSNVQSTEVSRKTPVSRRIRGNEEVIVDGANVKQLRRQIYGLYRTNNPSQYGGGMVGRPSANPLFGVRFFSSTIFRP